MEHIIEKLKSILSVLSSYRIAIIAVQKIDAIEQYNRALLFMYMDALMMSFIGCTLGIHRQDILNRCRLDDDLIEFFLKFFLILYEVCPPIAIPLGNNDAIFIDNRAWRRGPDDTERILDRWDIQIEDYLPIVHQYDIIGVLVYV